jgi:phosphohistidine phosphatase
MDLILWRHADAEDAAGGDDLQRALTPRGRDQAARMVAWLADRLAPDTRILVSPALRCRETAAALARATTMVEALAPGGSAAALLSAAGWPDAAGAVLVVGHQPTLGDAAVRALGESGHGRPFEKAAVCWLRVEPGRADARVHASMRPDDL